MISECLQILYLVHCVALGTLHLLFTVVYLTIVEFPILGLNVFNPFISIHSLAFQHLYFIIILNYITTLVVLAAARGPVFAVCVW